MKLPKTVLHALAERAQTAGAQPALWTKRNGSYQPTRWSEYHDRVRTLALGLSALGFKAGDAAAIISFNREEWLLADLAAMALGGVATGIYTNSSPDQIQYVAHHCEAKVLIVENEGYLNSVL